MEEEEQKLTISGLKFLTEEQRKRQNNFYDFFSQQCTNNCNQMHYAKYIRVDFQKFPVGVGYPIIHLNCTKPECYLFIDLSKLQTYEHPFLKLLVSDQKYTYECKCGQMFKDSKNFILDLSLMGLYSIQLNKRQLQTLKEVFITKNNRIYINNDQCFDDNFNQCRLSKLAEIIPALTNHQKEGSIQIKQPQSINKTLRVKTSSILLKITSQLAKSTKLSGKKIQKRPQIKDSSDFYLLQVNFRQKGVFHFYHEVNKVGSFFSLNLKKDNNLQRVAQLFDESMLRWYVLCNDGGLYFCDFNYMYDFSSYGYRLQKLYNVEGLPKLMDYQIEHCKLHYLQNHFYLFLAQKDDNFLKIYKFNSKISQEGKVIATPILIQKLRYRFGYNCIKVGVGQLVKGQCFVIYGGSLEKNKKFKMLDIILFKNNEEQYLYHKINVNQNQFMDISVYFPTLAIYQRKLIIWRGYRDNDLTKLNKQIFVIGMEATGDRPAHILKIDDTSHREQTTSMGSYIEKIGVLMRGNSRLGLFDIMKINKNGEVFQIEITHNYIPK